MLNRLNSLISLDHVLHLSAGPIFRNKSASSLYNFTHLKCFTRSMMMAVDWVFNLENGLSSLVVKPISAIKITFLKLKEGLGETEKGFFFYTIGGIKSGVGKDCIEHISFGENISARAKRFTIGYIAVCGGGVGYVGFESRRGGEREGKG
ncbi:hypothetical protein MKX01_028578 [Papaver californicum]|nr:hypothetical protein MKX01_028578 [Papaver californicum]